MDPVPLQNCLQQLNSLSYSPILGNNSMSKDSFSQIPVKHNKPKILSAASAAKPITPAQTISTKKRLFSDTSPPSPSCAESKSKQIKMNLSEPTQV